MSFTEWLKDASNGDPDGMMPYAPLYEVADELGELLGDSFDLNMSTVWFRETYGAAKAAVLTDALATAEANWRLDELVISDPEAMETAAELVAARPDPPEVVVDSKSLAKALPPLPCGFRGVDGNECSRPAVLGAARCVAHGGMILDPEVRRSLLVSAHAKMLRNSEFAIETLLDVMDSGRNDVARVQAAKELLDRAGMTAEQHIVLSDNANVLDESEKARERVDLLKSRLGKTRDRLRLTSIVVDAREDETG